MDWTKIMNFFSKITIYFLLNKQKIEQAKKKQYRKKYQQIDNSEFVKKDIRATISRHSLQSRRLLSYGVVCAT